MGTKSIKNKDGYMSNKELYDEVIKCQQAGYVSDELAKMFMLLSEKNATHRYFIRYPYQEDLIMTGVLACVRGYDKFDPERGDNAFAYFTSCIWNAFKQYIKKEYYFKNVKDEVMVDNEMNPSYGYDEFHESVERKKNKLHEEVESGDEEDA